MKNLIPYRINKLRERTCRKRRSSMAAEILNNFSLVLATIQHSAGLTTVFIPLLTRKRRNCRYTESKEISSADWGESFEYRWVCQASFCGIEKRDEHRWRVFGNAVVT